MLSVVIPARNEESTIEKTVKEIYGVLKRESIIHEIIVVDDGSTDYTNDKLLFLRGQIFSLKILSNLGEHGFGRAVSLGLDNFRGDMAAIMMADGSDSPEDLVRFYKKMEDTGADCVFGSRFIEGGRIINYPKGRLLPNRIANTAIKIVLGLNYNDVTNAFKLYKKEVIESIKPLRSGGFSLTIEMPLKAINRGFSFVIVPNSWTGRSKGRSKFRLTKELINYFLVFVKAVAEKYGPTKPF